MKVANNMQPGVKYPGYGFVNEYGEFQFTPSEVGSRKEQKKLVKETNDSSVYKTNKYIILHCKVERRLSLVDRIKKIVELMNEFIVIFRSYEI